MMTTKSGNNSNILFKILLEGQYSNEFLKNRIRALRVGSKTIKSHIFGAATEALLVVYFVSAASALMVFYAF